MLFDLNGDGLITKNEIETLFGEGGDINEQMWQEILQECDKNNDGMVMIHISISKISRQEFIELLESKMVKGKDGKLF
jgi:calcium-dependent protein kinase